MAAIAASEALRDFLDTHECKTQTLRNPSASLTGRIAAELKDPAHPQEGK